MKISLRYPTVVFLVTALSACGGGGGGGGKKSTPNNSTQSVSSVAQSSVAPSSVSDISSVGDASSVSDISSVGDASSVSDISSMSDVSSMSDSTSSVNSSAAGVLSLVSTTPENNATGVDPTEPLTMTFSTTLANSPDPTSYVTLTKDAGSSVPFSASISNMTLWVTPTEKLAVQTPYQVSVSTDALGVAGEQLASASMLNFTTRDGVWGDALSIGLQHSGDESEPQIATDTNGNAIAIWQKKDDDKTNIVTASYSQMGWSDPIVLGSDINALQAGRIAMNASGQAIAIWGKNGDIKAKIYTPETGTWGALTNPEGASDPGILTSKSLQVAMDMQGNAIAIWTAVNNVWVNRYTPDTGWDTAIELDTSNSSIPDTQIVVDAVGNALVVWKKGNQLMSSRYTLGGVWSTSWSTPTIVKDSGVNRTPHLSINASGNAALIWGEGSTIVTSFYSTASGWTTPTLLNAASQTNSKIALDNDGNAIAVWMQADASTPSIWTSRYSVTTSTWSAPELIEKDNAGAAGNPQVAIDETGNAIVVWEQTVAGSNKANLYASRYVMGGAWGEPTLLEVENFDSVNSPQVAINKFGEAFVVWSQKLINNTISIWANKFE